MLHHKNENEISGKMNNERAKGPREWLVRASEWSKARRSSLAKTNSEFKQEWEVSFLYFQSPVRPTTIIAMAVIRASI